MTDNSRTADQIERDITSERAALSDTIYDLQDRFSVRTIVNDIGDMVRDQGGDVGRAVSNTVSRNPAAVMLTTVGLAWLFLGQGNKSGDYRRAGSGSNSDTMMHRMRDGAAAISDKASDLTDRLSHGLEDLSDEAKSRVLAARHAAHDAQVSSQKAMKKGSRAATGFFDDQPLVVGALAVAAGAAIGGLLPHSRIEDDAMGATSDQLYADAQALYRKERDMAAVAAKTAANDVKDEFGDVGQDLKGLLPEGKNVGEVIVDRTADATKRVIDHATEAANGKPKGSTQA